MTINAVDARAYLARWTSVSEMEIAELRSTSMDTKLRQLASLMASREIFGADPNREQSVETVREGWARLRQALSA
jgi:hypothetical protein